MHFCKQHTSYSFDPFVIIVQVYLGLYSLSLLWPLLLGLMRLSTLLGNMAEALAVVALYVEVAHAPSAIRQQSAHKYAVPSTIFSVDLVIVLFRVDNTCHRSCDLVTCHTLRCI